jgi:hypothetical protein
MFTSPNGAIYCNRGNEGKLIKLPTVFELEDRALKHLSTKYSKGYLNTKKFLENRHD